MAWGIPGKLSFTPKLVLPYSSGYVIVGVDGELQKISQDGEYVGLPTKPFPTPIRDAVIIGDTLVATWLDQELMLARMAALDLTKEFTTGVERGDLRVRRTIDKSIHPSGNKWSHVLDAEPISLSANGASFSFVLWKKGVYNLSANSIENWRSSEPSWMELQKIPRAMETIASTCDDDKFEIWSKGGGLIRYDVKSGAIIHKDTISLDGYLNKVFMHNENYLLLFNNSNIVLFENSEIVLNAKLSGPITHADWCNEQGGWYVAGWREILFVSKDTQRRIPLEEIAVFVEAKTGLYLCNDGNWDIIESGDSN